MRLFLLLSEAQSSGFVRVFRPEEMYARWRSGLQIKILKVLFFNKCCAIFIFRIHDKLNRCLKTCLNLVRA